MKVTTLFAGIFICVGLSACGNEDNLRFTPVIVNNDGGTVSNPTNIKTNSTLSFGNDAANNHFRFVAHSGDEISINARTTSSLTASQLAQCEEGTGFSGLTISSQNSAFKTSSCHSSLSFTPKSGDIYNLSVDFSSKNDPNMGAGSFIFSKKKSANRAVMFKDVWLAELNKVVLSNAYYIDQVDDQYMDLVGEGTLVVNSKDTNGQSALVSFGDSVQIKLTSAAKVNSIKTTNVTFLELTEDYVVKTRSEDIPNLSNGSYNTIADSKGFYLIDPNGIKFSWETKSKDFSLVVSEITDNGAQVIYSRSQQDGESGTVHFPNVTRTTVSLIIGDDLPIIISGLTNVN